LNNTLAILRTVKCRLVRQWVTTRRRHQGSIAELVQVPGPLDMLVRHIRLFENLATQPRPILLGHIQQRPGNRGHIAMQDGPHHTKVTCPDNPAPYRAET